MGFQTTTPLWTSPWSSLSGELPAGFSEATKDVALDDVT